MKRGRVATHLILATGTVVGILVGWFFDSLMLGLIVLGVWAVLGFPVAMAYFAVDRVESDVRKEILKK